MTPIDEIKARLDLVSYIGRTVSLKKAGRTYKACCPFHNENTPSFVVDPDKGMWRCYGACATGGDLFAFVMKRNGWTFAEALRELAREAGVELKPQTPEQKQQADRLDKLRGLLKEAAAWYHARLFSGDAEAAAALTYARERRGLTPATLEQFQIGYAPNAWTALADHLRHLGYADDDLVAVGLARRSDQGRVYDAFRWRLLIPIRDERGQVVGFGGRALDPDEKAKYINSPQTALFDKSRILFGLDQAAPHIRRSETAVIVEGYMDAITAQQAGYTNVVAQMGTALTEHQLKLIAPKWAKTIVLALDSDAAGQSATLRSLAVIKDNLHDQNGLISVDVRIVVVPGSKDPDDYIRQSPSEWGKLVDRAVPFDQYVIDQQLQTLPENPTLYDKEMVLRKILPLVFVSPKNLTSFYKLESIRPLAEKFEMEEKDILAWAGKGISFFQNPQSTSVSKSSQEANIVSSTSEVQQSEDYGQTANDDVLKVPDSLRQSSKPILIPSKKSYGEEYLLRILFQDPQLYYNIGRKFYELSADDDSLVFDILSDISGTDFYDSYNQIFMYVFVDAIEQVEMDPSDYIQLQLGETLTQTLKMILIDESDYTRQRTIGDRMHGDFTDVWKRHTSRGSFATLDRKTYAVTEALKLRLKRIARELEQERLLLTSKQPQNQQYTIDDAATRLERLQQLLRARQLIETELNRLSRGGK